MTMKSLALALAALSVPTCLVASPPEAAAAAPARPGVGWTAVTLAASPSAAPRLVLVSPTGAQRPVGVLPAGSQVWDVSNDGSRVLVNTFADRNPWLVVETASGRSRRVRGNLLTATFTNPTGLALLAATEREVVKTDLTGRVRVRYPDTNPLTNPRQDPSGRLVVAHGSGRYLGVHDNATGRQLRRIPMPAGAEFCTPRNWRSASTFVAYCLVSTSARTLTYRTYEMSTSGTTPRLLAPTRVVGQHSSDIIGVWDTPAGRFAEVAKRDTFGAHRLARVTGQQAVPLPVPAASSLWVIGTTAYLHESDQPRSEDGLRLSLVDLRTGRRVLLAGGTRNPGLRVTSAMGVVTTS